MIEFIIDPPSGHADSYFDVKFVITLESKVDKAVVSIFNRTMQQQLEIIGVTSGFIANETQAIFKNTKVLEGYINIFNQDKLNSGLNAFVAVNIECEVDIVSGEDTSKETAAVTFYNESLSIDGSVIPFDFKVENPNIDLKRNVPLKMQATCFDENRYEIVVRSRDGSIMNTIEFIGRLGVVEFVIPSEVLFYNLKLDKNLIRKFSIYYVKYEGVDLSGFVNRKFIPIAGTDLTFNSNSMMPEPQERLDPTGSELSDDFILSDRFFVPTWREFSQYKSREKAPRKNMLDMTRFMHEVHHMQEIEQRMMSKSNVKEQNKISRAIRKASLSDRAEKQKLKLETKPTIMGGLATTYAHKIVSSKSTNLDYVNRSVQEQASPAAKKLSKSSSKSGGCGCSRKKKKHA